MYLHLYRRFKFNDRLRNGNRTLTQLEVNCEVITIGDELLIGQVVDTNSAYIARSLNSIGFMVSRRNAVGDNEMDILNALREASSRVKVVITTGGLGPTRDDITKKVYCKYFEVTLKFFESSFKDLEKLFEHRGRTMTELNRSQAEMPENCEPLSNRLGTAPGMWFEKNDCIFIALPGVPYEMEDLMNEQVLPRLKKRFTLDPVFHRTIITTGVPESVLADRIREWEDNLPAFFKLAYLPQPGMVRLRLSGLDKPFKELEKIAEQKVQELKSIIGKNIIGEGESKPEIVTAELFRKNGKTLSVAESCTGGYLGHLITSIAGSSSYFMGGIVAYSNQLKEKLLEVKTGTLEHHGAVSEETVLEMAENCRQLLNTDYSLAISGVAGPGGGTAEKPVGMVWIAVSGPDGTHAKRFQFGKNREVNIKLSAAAALELLRREVLGIVEK